MFLIFKTRSKDAAVFHLFKTILLKSQKDFENNDTSFLDISLEQGIPPQLSLTFSIIIYQTWKGGCHSTPVVNAFFLGKTMKKKTF